MKSLLVLALFSIIFVGFVGIAEAYDGNIRVDKDKGEYIVGDIITISGYIYRADPIPNELVVIEFTHRNTGEQIDTAIIALDSEITPLADGESSWTFNHQIDTTDTLLQSETHYYATVKYGELEQRMSLKFRDPPAQQAVAASQLMEKQEQQESLSVHEIPDWVKEVFAMYSRGDISDSELIAAIQFLISVDIIRI